MTDARIVAVDVGTSSVRAAVFDLGGAALGHAVAPIALQAPRHGYAEYASEDVWRAVGSAVRGALDASGVAGERIAAIGFDATTSLVLRDAAGRPLSLTPTSDTIAWCDHRAVAEAEACTASGHPALGPFGGTMSPEMQLPKLLWLKRHRPELWQRLAHAFDLADFLTWRATGRTARSLCTLASKWGYRAEQPAGWDTGFLGAIGLDDLVVRGGLPKVAHPVGSDLGPLEAAAARDLGLTTTCRVAAGMVDAHAGALAALGVGDDACAGVLVGGTSSCVMVAARTPLAVPGFWGPHWGTVRPDRWTLEGGQSASGALLDYVLRLAPDGLDRGLDHRWIVARIAALRADHGPDLAPRLHLLPDFAGMRSPRADARALGVISGLDLDLSVDGICRLYWRAAVAIALGIGEIVDALGAAGLRLERLIAAGGHVRNPLLPQLYADATGLPIVLAADDAGDFMLRGGAVAAAVAMGAYADPVTAAAAMAPARRRLDPDPAARSRMERDLRVFRLMREQRRAVEALCR